MKHRKYFSAGVTTAIAFLAITSASQAQAVNANRTLSNIYLNDNHVYIAGYNINGNNYFKLRDLADELSESANNFDVVWNETAKQVELITGKDYSGTTGNYNPDTSAVNAVESSSKLIINGKETNVTAYNINGSNYYKLRDLGENLGFDVRWQQETDTIFLYALDENMHVAERGNYEPPKSQTDNGMDITYIPTESFSKTTDMTATISTARWSNVIENYIVNDNDGTFYSLYKKSPNSNYIYADIYDSKTYELLNTQKVETELDLFGGFYSGEKYNYIVFGQNNTEENDEKEIIRIVKYDKQFNRIDDCSIKGEESFTTKPFDAGTVRMAENGNELTIHTSRERYTTDDGLNHQSQLTIILDTDTMKTKNYLGRFQKNHVSHSFNQFAQYDGDKLILVDHGDAYPRSIVLNKESGSEFTEVDLFKIPGAIGANCTGVTIGGFEISDTNYLVAINSIDHNKVTEYTSYEMIGLDLDERDIILLTCDKNTNSVKQIKFTDYINNNMLGSTPYLVKIDDNRFMLMWEEFIYNNKNAESNGMKYVEIDGNGNKLTEIMHNKNFNLSSDCKPQVIDNQIVWYNNVEMGRIFYSIDI